MEQMMTHVKLFSTRRLIADVRELQWESEVRELRCRWRGSETQQTLSKSPPGGPVKWFPVVIQTGKTSLKGTLSFSPLTTHRDESVERAVRHGGLLEVLVLDQPKLPGSGDWQLSLHRREVKAVEQADGACQGRVWRCGVNGHVTAQHSAQQNCRPVSTSESIHALSWLMNEVPNGTHNVYMHAHHLL